MMSLRRSWWPTACLVVLAGCGVGRGQDGERITPPTPPAAARGPELRADPAAVEDLAARVTRLERQNATLLQLLRQPTLGPGSTLSPSDSGGRSGPTALLAGPQPTTGLTGAGLGGPAREGDPGPPALPPGGLSGSATTGRGIDLGRGFGLRGRWVNHQPWLESDDGAFRIHFGGRTQLDAIWAAAPDRVRFGKGGVGEFQDAVNFRRARLEIDGWMYDYFDFFCEYDFVNSANVDPTTAAREGNVINTPVPTELWGGVNFLPWLGTVRIGNQKNPIGLEHLISSRYLDFLERAPYFDTYLNRNNGMQPGIQAINWTNDQRLTYQFGLFKNNQGIYGWNPGGGELEFNARATWLPWYEDNGRYMIHLGLGGQYDEPDNQNAVLRYRWALRNGPATLHSTVALASIFGHHQTLFQPEFFMNLGPLSIMSEYTFNYLDHIWAYQTQSQGMVGVPTGDKTYVSQAWYVQAMYFLTGEYRPYYPTGLHHSGASPTRVVPNRTASRPRGSWFNPFSIGAWQVGARYAYSQMTDNGIYGGNVHEVTLGVNWFLTPNMKVQWNYDIGYRGNLGPASTSSGPFQGFGTRCAIDF